MQMNMMNQANSGGRGAFMTEQQNLLDDYSHSGGQKLSDASRLGFIKKVYSILSVQLILTVVVCALIGANEDLKHAIHKNPAIFIIAIVVSLSTMCMLACSKDMARSVPLNYILLFLFTVA